MFFVLNYYKFSTKSSTGGGLLARTISLLELVCFLLSCTYIYLTIFLSKNQIANFEYFFSKSQLNSSIQKALKSKKSGKNYNKGDPKSYRLILQGANECYFSHLRLTSCNLYNKVFESPIESYTNLVQDPIVRYH